MKVEALLADAFFLKLGKYVATCAHIERMAWLLVVHSAGFDLNDDADIARILELRRRTPDLITALGDAAENHDAEFGERFRAASGRISDGIINRHMAVHGAWSTRDDGQYKVEYYNNVGTGKAPNWRAFVAAISEGELDAALLDADNIFSELLSLYKDIGFP